MASIPNADILNSEISDNLDANIKNMETLFNLPENEDIIVRRFSACGFGACVVYVEGMADENKISDFIIRESQASVSADTQVKPNERIAHMLNVVISIGQTDLESRFSVISKSVLSGMTCLLIDGANEAIMLETRGFDKRNVSHTNNESVVSGSQEGFVENLRSNLTLMRRYVQSPELITHKLTIGKKIPTRIAIMYMRGVADPKVLAEVRRRIMTIDKPIVQGSGQLQQLIEDNRRALLPQLLQTERPDRAASCVNDGQIVILCDNSPYALIAPVTIFHLLHASDDSFMRWQYGTVLRIIRFIGITLSLFLPGLYIALTNFHPHLIPMSLLTSIAESRTNVPFTIVTEVMIMQISFFLINEAGTRIPSQIGNALGIVGALILGQAAVSASIISPILIIIIAITGLGNFTIPNYGFSVGILVYRLIIVAASATLGLFGFTLATFAILVQICAMRSFGVPYVAPIAPYRKHNGDIIIRLPLKFQKTLTMFAKPGTWIKE